MPRAKQAIDEKVEMQQAKRTIDNVLQTLYANDQRGYFGISVTPDEFKSEGIKLIERKISSLDRKHQQNLELEYKKRIAKFDAWHTRSSEEKERLAKLAAKDKISLEEAASKASGAARS
jgi:hypothetical protein